MKKIIFIGLLIMATSCDFKKEDSTVTGNENVSDTLKSQGASIDAIVVDTIITDAEVNSKTAEKKQDGKENKIETGSKAETMENKTQGVVSANDEWSNDMDHSLWNALLKKNVSSNGNVNYKGFISDKLQLEAYLEKLSNKIPDDSWSKNAKLAYWINAYNAFTVKLIVDNYPLKSIKNIANPWTKKFIVLNNVNYSLEQIENEILRKMNEPRIHFAINCASYSCPDLHISAYTSSALESQLTMVTKKFLNDTSKNNLAENEIKVSQIFNWFADDFKAKNGSVINFIDKYATTQINDDAKLNFNEYNWNLNE